MKLSACWIAKNEEANLGKSIESVREAVDEIIVVDTGSTDNTVAIARSYGARVEHFAWIDDFSAARNYALSFATGDIFIFLDADEYFDPALTAESGKAIAREFETRPAIKSLTIKMTNLDTVTGEILEKTVTSRIFRNGKSSQYAGKIHEEVFSILPAETAMYDLLHICHTGYNSSVIIEKHQRNYKLLLHALEETSDKLKRMQYLIYLASSAKSIDRSNASKYLFEVLRDPDSLLDLCKLLSPAWIYYLYSILSLATQERKSVTRKEIDKKLISLFHEVYPDYAGTKEVDLMYQIFFDQKENLLLQELPVAVKSADSLAKFSSESIYNEYEKNLFAAAAIAAWRRSDFLLAMEYAVSSLRDNRKKHEAHPVLMSVLLSSIKEQTPADIVLFLSSLFSPTNPQDLDFLIQHTILGGLQEVHAYYVKKRQELGDAPVDHLLHLLLPYGRFDEAIANGAYAYDAGHAGAASWIFLSALCGAPGEAIDVHREKLGEYIHLLDAFYHGTPLENPSDADRQLLQITYPLVAFFGGIPQADRLLAVFQNLPKDCFFVKALYCQRSGLPELIVAQSTEGIDRLDFDCYSFRIQALLHTQRVPEALEEIEVFLNARVLEQDLMHQLLVAAEQGEGETQEKARRYYDAYITLFDEIIDLGDVVNTGIVVPEGNQRQKNRGLKNLSRDHFSALLSTEKDRVVSPRLLELSREAIGIFTQHDLPDQAIRCLVRLIAHDAGEPADYQTLSDLFLSLGNRSLAKHLSALAE